MSSAPRALSSQSLWPCLPLAAGVLACNVEAAGSPSGGIGEAAARGFVVIHSDFRSTSVSVVATAGEVLSPNILSSSSVPPGLSTALSGDVVPPTSPALADEIVLIDRLPAGVLTWLDLSSGDVRAQLNVSTGFAANPHDYVPLSAGKALVTRSGANLDPGRESLDQGNDVLVVDPRTPALTGRIDLLPAVAGEDPQFLPSADRALLAGGLVRVTALGFNVDFSAALDTRIVSIDPMTDEIVDVTVVPGMKSCTGLALSPDGAELALACNGLFGAEPMLADSGIVLFDVGSTPSEKQRFSAAELGGERINALSYASPTSLVFTTFGRYSDDLTSQAAPDTLRRLDLSRGVPDAEPLARTASVPFSFGDLRCATEAKVCVLADAETSGGVLRRFEVDDGGHLVSEALLEVEAAVGLPPRYIGAY